MITRISTTRRRAALVSSGALLLGAAAVATATAASSGGTSHPTQHSHPYADYLDDQGGGDPCALPPAQRSGGWVCPAADGQK